MSFKLGLTLLGVASILSTTANECNDADWDNYQDDVDDCIDIYNPGQLDTDSDGLGDPCDSISPDLGGRMGGCYISNWSGFRGTGWTDIITQIEPAANGNYQVSFYWKLGGGIESGELQFNGGQVWSMAFSYGIDLHTATFVEGSTTTLDADGTIGHIEGPYQMIDCSSCSESEPPETWDSVADGTWTAERHPDIDCANPP